MVRFEHAVDAKTQQRVIEFLAERLNAGVLDVTVRLLSEDKWQVTVVEVE